jgi:hypothetical protein
VPEPTLEPVATGRNAIGIHPWDFYPSLQVFPADLLQQGDPIAPELRKDLPMKRILFLPALVAAVLAVPATASAFSGVVVAKNPTRHTVVVASRGGVVRTVRAPHRVRALRAGQRLVVSARRLSDGTFAARAIKVTGRAGRAVLRGIIVRQRGSSYLLSSGGSVISVRAGSRGFSMASDRRHRAGDIVVATVRVTGKGLTASSIRTLGHSDGLELEGIFLGVTGNQLRLAVEHRGEVFVTVPDGFQLPELNPGDEIELVVSVDAAGAFTLVAIQADDENDEDNEGINEENGRVEVKGQITGMMDGNITVQSRGGSPVTCAVPYGTSLSGFKVGDRVEMRCALVNAKLTLTRLKHEDDDDGGGDGGGD